MPRRGENIYKRKDGRWEGRYIRGRTPAGKAEYGYVYAKSYAACREKRRKMEEAIPQKHPPVPTYSRKGLAGRWPDRRLP